MILFYLFSYYNYCISYNMYLSRIILLYILMEILTIRVQCNWHSVCMFVCECVYVCWVGTGPGFRITAVMSVPTPPYL